MRPAATVVLIRPDGAVLLVRRNLGASFFAGAYAFPGGKVEDNDIPAQAAPLDALDANANANANANVWAENKQPPTGLDRAAGDRARLYEGYVAAARREVQEEIGVTLSSPLAPWARWITPEAEPRRYDTLFFIAEVPNATAVKVDGGEIVSHLWLSPEEACARCDAGDIALPPPTYITLVELGQFSTREALFSARRFPRPEVMPKIVNEGGSVYLLMPGDEQHDQPRVIGWPMQLTSRIRIFASGAKDTPGKGTTWRFVGGSPLHDGRTRSLDQATSNRH
jgi:8-oxo-dGTP pyrophosphatase MutT (NUDIX family)